MRLGRKIAESREELKLSQLELSKHLGVKERIVGKWERNTRVPRRNELNMMVHLFEWDIDEITGGKYGSYFLAERLFGLPRKVFWSFVAVIFMFGLFIRIVMDVHYPPNIHIYDNAHTTELADVYLTADDGWIKDDIHVAVSFEFEGETCSFNIEGDIKSLDRIKHNTEAFTHRFKTFDEVNCEIEMEFVQWTASHDRLHFIVLIQDGEDEVATKEYYFNLLSRQDLKDVDDLQGYELKRLN